MYSVAELRAVQYLITDALPEAYRGVLPDTSILLTEAG